MATSDITTLTYNFTNNYLIPAGDSCLMVDTDWPGTIPRFFAALAEQGLSAQMVTHLMVTHFHPDHAGTVEELKALGVEFLVVDLQIPFISVPERIFRKDKRLRYEPIRHEGNRIMTCVESRQVLASIGIGGEIIWTPGHSDDSVSISLDSGEVFVGDLPSLFDAPAYGDEVIEQSWNTLLSHGARHVFPGHGQPYNAEGIASIDDLR